MSIRIRVRLAAKGAVAVASAIGFTAVPTPVGATTTSPMAYVTNSQLHTVSVYQGAQFAGTISHAGPGPTGIAIDSTGSMAYVADYGFLDEPAKTVTPLDLATGTPEAPITVGTGPLAIAVVPGNRFALVTLQGTADHPGHRVVEINLTTRAVSSPVNVGLNPESLAVTPDGTTAYVAAFGSAEVTPVDLTSWPPRVPRQSHSPAPRRGPSPSHPTA